ncbi:Oxidoreductase FAD-binding domain-containing protein [Cladophialophora immunda]|nr:Oxidoreductase FAD-binding domain-containing protein [Cladophialophora immunda]
MEVLAVSAATPRWEDINGKRTMTSIVRESLPGGEIQITAKGVKGNQPAMHDGPVYAFFAHHYDYWCKELSYDRTKWKWCHWGENITFDCDDKKLTEREFRLGDIWTVGKTVRLEVCGARIPCFKLSWRCGQKDSWLKPLADSGYSGVYFRVLETGTIRVGDRASLIERRLDTIDCATISKLAFNASLKTRDTMNLLANEELLVNMLRASFGRRVLLLDDQAREGVHGWKGWRKFSPFKIVDEGGGIKSFYLKPLDENPLATFRPGQFLTVRLPTGDMRSWSLSDWPRGPGAPSYYRLSIKRSRKASVWMTDECNLDTVLEVRSPQGRFALDWTPLYLPRQVYLSAGVGITPIFSMLKAHAAHGAFPTIDAIWIHVARNGAEIPFREEMAQLPKTLRRIWYFTAPREHEKVGRDYEVHGRPDTDLLRRVVAPDYHKRYAAGTSLPVEGRLSSFYICGSSAFDESMHEALAALDVPLNMIHAESFTAGADAAQATDLEEAVVRFTASNIEAVWRRAQPMTLLDLAESVGLQPDSGCRAGVCGACSSRLVCGVTTGGMQSDGSVLICAARPACPRIEIAI